MKHESHTNHAASGEHAEGGSMSHTLKVYRDIITNELSFSVESPVAKAKVILEAAPEMLAALELAIVALGQMGGNMSDGPYRKEWLACRDAIQKATVRE